MKRISRMLIFLGVLVMMITVISGAKTRNSLMVIDLDSPEGVIFESNHDIHVNVTLDNSVGTFNMYLLHWHDANDTMAQNQSSDPISPISSFENITSFYGTLHLPLSGTFVLLFTTNSTDLLIIQCDISTQGINTRAFLGGLIFVGSGMVFIVFRRLYEYYLRVPSHETNG
ncbi:MAG: hypothetical protein ACTSUB_09885 [Candidatus Thorarchaeota archaeon]